MPSTKTSLGDKMEETMQKTVETTTTKAAAAAHLHSTDPQPEDLPFDASPGTDEEFGVHAATMHVEHKERAHRDKSAASEHFGDSIEGVLLSG